MAIANSRNLNEITRPLTGRQGGGALGSAESI